jgi:phospholipid transport system substrate-binding protein
MPNDLPGTRAGLSRRAVLGSTAALAALWLGPAWAASTAQAEALITKVVADIQAIINSGISEAAMLGKFEALFRRYADVPVIARSALGTPWKAATAAQQQQFVAAFSTYLSRKYGKQFRSFIGAKIDILRSRDAGQKGILVESQAKLQGKAPFAVEWQVSDGSGQLKFVNLNIEGVWLLTTEREEIGAMLDKRGGDLNRLIVDLPNLG